MPCDGLSNAEPQGDEIIGRGSHVHGNTVAFGGEVEGGAPSEGPWKSRYPRQCIELLWSG